MRSLCIDATRALHHAMNNDNFTSPAMIKRKVPDILDRFYPNLDFHRSPQYQISL